MNTPQNPAPQWCAEAAAEIHGRLQVYCADTPAIIARHAPQPTAPTAQPSDWPLPKRIDMPDGSTHRTFNGELPPATGGTATPCPSGGDDTIMKGQQFVGFCPPRTKASDTPRVDEEEIRYHGEMCVPANFARTLETELAEARAERDRLDAELERMYGQPGSFAERDRLQHELTAHEGVIARLREALERLIESGDSMAQELNSGMADEAINHARAALSLTPATYGDALAKAEAEVERLTNLKESAEKYADEFRKERDALRAELAAMTGNAEKERLDKEAAQRELAGLRGLVAKVCVAEESRRATVEERRWLTELANEVRAHLAKQENPS